MRYTIWYHLYNLKNVKNTHGGLLLLVKSQALKAATVLKVTLLHGCFSRFLNCTNGSKSRNTSHIPLSKNIPVNPIQDGPFRGCSRLEWGQEGPLHKICHIYPMKLGTIIKYINHVTHLLSSVTSSFFSPKISNFCYIKKYRYKLYFNV